MATVSDDHMEQRGQESLETLDPSSDDLSLSQQQRSPLVNLPAELIGSILSYLSPWHLATVSAVCRSLRDHANSDLHWQRIIQRHVPGATVVSPGPFSSFRDLYTCHDLLWFLPQYKVWFCDHDRTGKLIIVRYDTRRGCIEGYRLLAVSKIAAHEHWNADSNVSIHDFQALVTPHLDKPVLRFQARLKESASEDETGGYTAFENFVNRPGANRFADERPMALEERTGGMYSNFLLARALEQQEVDQRMAQGFPYGHIWPPPAIPAQDRVSGARSGEAVYELSPRERPRRRSQVSDKSFRIRHWAEMAARTQLPVNFLFQPGGFAGVIQSLNDMHAGGLHNFHGFGAGLNFPGVNIGEEVTTYSTLDPALYTPTETKPWRGIWVGDYGLHGCEFLLVHQPDDSGDEPYIVRDEDESDQDWEKRLTDARMYRGKMEGIKLTGDPNVPRGEKTFIVDDLASSSIFESSDLDQFVGCRFARSKGHIADANFVGDTYIDCQLIIISHNRLAQYWIEFSHISYFERVDIDQYLAS